MNCPKCNNNMDYEEIKWSAGVWYCSCGTEYYGERFRCGTDDHEERIGEAFKNAKQE